MTRDMVVALGRTTVDGRTLFGHTSVRPILEEQVLTRTPGRCYSFGEKVRSTFLELSQPRQTYTVLGSRARGAWGYHHGLNDQSVAIGCTALRTRLTCRQQGLLGTDLVRLGLERAATARQAVDVLTDLITRYGQGGGNEAAQDSAFLIAGAREAFAVEASGSHWVYQEIQQVRAMGDGCTIHQDWDRISGGLAGLAIEQGWWPGDGSKLDFAAAVGLTPLDNASTMRRWGRATLLLEEQNGHIDAAFIRRLLGNYDEQEARSPLAICRHESPGDASAAAVSLAAQLGETPVGWFAFGPPCSSVYLPVFVDGDLPQSLGERSEILPHTIWSRMRQLHSVRGDEVQTARVRTALSQLQARLDQETEDFLAESAIHRSGNRAEFARLAGLFMQHAVERFEAVVEGLVTQPRPGRERQPSIAAPAALHSEFGF